MITVENFFVTLGLVILVLDAFIWLGFPTKNGEDKLICSLLALASFLCFVVGLR